MQLEPVTKIDRRNRTMSKIMEMMSFQQVLTPLLFFRFMVNLKQPGNRILDAWSVIPTYSLAVTFYLSKTENRTETQLSYYCFE